MVTNELHLHASNPVFHFTDSVCWLEECKYTQLLIWLKYHYLWGKGELGAMHRRLVLYKYRVLTAWSTEAPSWTGLGASQKKKRSVTGVMNWSWSNYLEVFVDCVWTQQGNNLRPSHERIVSWSQDESWTFTWWAKNWSWTEFRTDLRMSRELISLRNHGLLRTSHELVSDGLRELI